MVGNVFSGEHVSAISVYDDSLGVTCRIVYQRLAIKDMANITVAIK